MRPFLESSNVENRTFDPFNTILSPPRFNNIGLKYNQNIVAEGISAFMHYVRNTWSNRKSL